jgi:hypothetical protein
MTVPKTARGLRAGARVRPGRADARGAPSGVRSLWPVALRPPRAVGPGGDERLIACDRAPLLGPSSGRAALAVPRPPLDASACRRSTLLPAGGLLLVALRRRPPASRSRSRSIHRAARTAFGEAPSREDYDAKRIGRGAVATPAGDPDSGRGWKSRRSRR